MTSTNLHTLVHIGAGAGNQLAEYQRLKLQKLVLIEPLPTQAKELRRLTADMPNAEVWELAVSCQANNQPATLIEYNLTQVSSLHPATDLKQLFPGIRVVQQHQVSTISPQTLAERLQLRAEQCNQLVVEACGEEQAILDSLLECNLLSVFQQILVTMPDMALYQCPHNPSKLLAKLQSHCYDLLGVDSTDPDFPLWQLSINPVKQELKSKQSELQHTNKLVETLQQQLEKIKTEANALKQKNEKLINDNNTLTEKQKILTKLQEQLKTEINAKDKAEQQLKATTIATEQVRHEKEQLVKEFNTLKEKEKRLSDLQHKHAELQKNHRTLLNEHQATQSRQQLLESELLKAEAQIELIKELMFSGNTI